jgi:hypothetical protein
MRIVGIIVAAVLAVALLPEGMPAEAAQKARKAKGQSSGSPDQAATMTAIAMAESGGNSGAQKPQRKRPQVRARKQP